jgi:hypothetical protein
MSHSGCNALPLYQNPHKFLNFMRSAVLLVLSVYVAICFGATGLSRNTANYLAQSFKPLGDLSKMQPATTGSGWTIEMWITYQPGVPTPARTRVLFTQLADSFCTSTTFDNFQYSVQLSPLNTVSATVQWCTGTLTTTALKVVPGGGKWTHVAVVFQYKKGIFIYYDGTLVRSSLQTLLPNDPTLVAFVGPLVNNGTIAMFDDTGLLDEIRFWNNAKGSSSISSNWCKRLGPSQSGLGWLVNFDSNLGGDGTTRIFLNETFDLASGHNNLLLSPLISASDLPQIETPDWCSTAQSQGAIVTAALIPSIMLVGVIVAFIVVMVTHFNGRTASKRKNIALAS